MLGAGGPEQVCPGSPERQGSFTSHPSWGWMVLSVNPHNALISLSLSRIPRRSWRIQITLKGEEWGERPPEQPPTPPTPDKEPGGPGKDPTQPTCCSRVQSCTRTCGSSPHHSIKFCKDKPRGPNLVLRAVQFWGESFPGPQALRQ